MKGEVIKNNSGKQVNRNSESMMFQKIDENAIKVTFLMGDQ
jgi:hypothetical protein